MNEFGDVTDEVPEADVFEHVVAASATSLADTGSLPNEVNEADAAEQAVDVDLDDDYDR